MDVADYLIIHNGALAGYQGECPSNVIFINLGSTQEFAHYLVKVVVDTKQPSDLAISNPELLEKALAFHMDHNPYALVEFKPAWGHIFAEFLEGYSHWGYSDLDILFGDLSRWITPDEWKDYDVVTYSFGDQHRLYARGQFTFHRNTEKVNNIWKSCTYLSDLDHRFAKVLAEKDTLKFESAEGCYSDALLSRRDISVKYAPKAWTDVETSDTVFSHGLYLTRDLATQRHVIYKAPRTQNGKMLAPLSNSPPYWFEALDPLYQDRQQPLHKDVGELEPLTLPNDPEAKCLYWARQTHQSKICLDVKIVNSNHNIIWRDGQLYKQEIQKEILASEVVTAPFFHFQEWKRSYRSSQLAPMHLSSRAATFILIGNGVIPLYHRGLLPPTTTVPSPLGIPLRQWKGEQTQLPKKHYCLVTVIEPHPDHAACQAAVSWQDPSTGVEILSNAPAWSAANVESDVTLTLTLQITSQQWQDPAILQLAMDRLVDNMQRWRGTPCVVLVHVAQNQANALSYVRQRFASMAPLDHALVALILPVQDGIEFVSRRALLNMAIDAVPTRWFMSGLEVERGLTLSTEAVFFTHKAIQSYSTTQGTIMWLPQFALASGTLDVSLSDLASLHEQGQVKLPEFFKEACDEPEGEHLNMTNSIWWNYTRELIGPANQPVDQDVVIQQAQDLVNLDEWLVRIMMEDTDNLESIYYLDESPILLTDNRGPLEGAWTHELVREAEELAGRRCYNGMRLGQLAALGYHFDVVPGAFALSTHDSSHGLLHNIANVNATATPSRCRGCYVYRGHYLLADEIADSDILRSVKTAITWHEDMHGKTLWTHEKLATAQ
jgi:hypothetical protein